MTGLATIRAFAWVQDEITQNKKLLNASQRPAYLLSMIQEWLNTNLLILVGVLAICLTGLATQLQTSAAFTGASLITLMNLTSGVAQLMQSYTALETSIGAVNRLQMFGRITRPEDEHDVVVEVPERWPAQGTVSLDTVSASYRYVQSRQVCSPQYSRVYYWTLLYACGCLRLLTL